MLTQQKLTVLIFLQYKQKKAKILKNLIILNKFLDFSNKAFKHQTFLSNVNGNFCVSNNLSPNDLLEKQIDKQPNLIVSTKSEKKLPVSCTMSDTTLIKSQNEKTRSEFGISNSLKDDIV